MRLWHEHILKVLPRQQLLGQHRECCALRGKGWNRKHSTVQYIFQYDIEKLIAYHMKVIKEMQNRGFNVNENWLKCTYRGKKIGHDYKVDIQKVIRYKSKEPVYEEHNDTYLKECLNNLENKGIYLDIGE